MPTRLLIVHNAYVHRGGEDTCVDHEIAALQSAGIEVLVHRVQTIPGWTARLHALAAPWGKGAMSTLERLLMEWRPDVLHAHNLFPLLSPRIFSVARSQGIKTVLTLHNYRPLCLNGLFLTPAHETCERCPGTTYQPGIVRGCYRGSRLQSLFMAGHLRKAHTDPWYSSVDRFIAPSWFLRDKFAQYGFFPERIVVQPHFLPDMPVARPERAESYVLYLGRLSEEKGIRNLLRLFKEQAMGCDLKIAGDGPLRRTVEKAQDPHIHYLGYVQGSDKTRLLSRASALILPSDCYENFPLAVLEANQFGVPVIAPERGGFPELIRPGVNGYLYPVGDHVSAAGLIRRVVNEHDDDLRQSTQNHVRKHYSAPAFLSTRLSFYDSLLSKSL